MNEVIISDCRNISESADHLKSLRDAHDHTPFIALVNRGEEIPANILSNCCGGHLFRDELDKLEALVKEMSFRIHDEHCL